jgi:sn-glycerol 3-phosphate transport system substrate-binding protein
LRLGNFVQIRTIIDEELEGVWAGKQDAKTALGRIEQRGNEQLARFARTAKE